VSKVAWIGVGIASIADWTDSVGAFADKVAIGAMVEKTGRSPLHIGEISAPEIFLKSGDHQICQSFIVTLDMAVVGEIGHDD